MLAYLYRGPRTYSLTLVAGLVLMLLASCTERDTARQGTASKSAASQHAVSNAAQKILLRGNGPEPDSLDPQRARNFESHNILRDSYECLTAIGKDASPVPALAQSWRRSADGLHYGFQLRAAARWSNGDAVTADDVVAGLRRLVDPATASEYAQLVDVIANASDIIAGRKTAVTLGVSAPDPHTVLIELSRPAPYLPGLLAHPSTCPVHRPTLARFGAEFSKPANSVSNGAFVLREWSQGSSVLLVRNPYYWNNAATHVDGVRFIAFNDPGSEYMRYRAGELHTTAVVPPSQFEQIRAERPKELHIGPQLGVYFYGFIMDREPFRSHPGLRRALSLAIDRERLVATVTKLGELPAYGWVPPGTWNYGSQSFDYAVLPMPKKLAEARQLYAAAGYSAAKPLQFELRYNTGELHSRLAVAIAGMWKASLGAQARLVAVEIKALEQDISARQMDMFRLAWIGDYNDPYTFLQYLKTGYGINLPHYHSDDYDQLLTKAAAEAEVALRRATLESAERLMLADHPVIPLYFYVNKHLVSPRVSGWYDNVMNVVYSKDLDLGP